MKKIIISNETIYFSLLFLFIILGAYIGYIIIQTYKEAVDGLMGLATIYLIHLLFVPPKDFFQIIPDKAVSISSIKYFAVIFLLGVVICWSIVGIVTSLYFYW